MDTHDELAALDATAQAELVRRGKISPGELVEAAIRRCERINPALNAIIHPAESQRRLARHAIEKIAQGSRRLAAIHALAACYPSD